MTFSNGEVLNSATIRLYGTPLSTGQTLSGTVLIDACHSVAYYCSVSSWDSTMTWNSRACTSGPSLTVTGTISNPFVYFIYVIRRVIDVAAYVLSGIVSIYVVVDTDGVGYNSPSASSQRPSLTVDYGICSPYFTHVIVIPVTSSPMTSSPLTTSPITTQAVSTSPLTTQAVTTSPATTQAVTTSPLTSGIITTQASTSSTSTASITTASVTSSDVSTGSILTTGSPITTNALTSGEIVTSSAVSTQAVTTTGSLDASRFEFICH